MPADWFRTSTHLLRPLCCHSVTLRTVSAALAKARSKDDWLLVRRLTPIFDREIRDRVGRLYDAFMLDLSRYTGSRARRNFEIVQFWGTGSAEALRRASLIYLERAD
jgi:hypothetical protein